MDKEMQAEIQGWKDIRKDAGVFKLPRFRPKDSTAAQDGAVARSPKMRDARSVRRVESMSRTPSPATISKRKRAIRGSIWSTTGSLPFGGAWISAASFDAVDFQDEQHLDSGLVLDPVEHAWMLMVAEGNFSELKDSLDQDPSLLYQRDFVTGYSIIHWIAKHGHHEDIIKLMDFASASGYRLDINTRASGGFTPLHIAAMQGHGMLIKVLVGAYGADVHIRDQSGRKAWQYLRPGTFGQFQELLGAPEEEEAGAFAVMNCNNNSHVTSSQDAAQSLDQVDSASKMTATVAPLRNLFISAYRFLKNW
ncbi:ankyrin repeat domain-containing protein SOWAHD [Pelodytes ibericus]